MFFKYNAKVKKLLYLYNNQTYLFIKNNIYYKILAILYHFIKEKFFILK